MKGDAPSHGHLRVSVEGRADDVLHWPGADVHPLVLRSVWLAQPDVLDYQVRQTGRGVIVHVLLERDTSLAALRDQLRTAGRGGAGRPRGRRRGSGRAAPAPADRQAAPRDPDLTRRGPTEEISSMSDDFAPRQQSHPCTTYDRSP